MKDTILKWIYFTKPTEKHVRSIVYLLYLRTITTTTTLPKALIALFWYHRNSNLILAYYKHCTSNNFCISDWTDQNCSTNLVHQCIIIKTKG
jgi:hypothetical protein